MFCDRNIYPVCCLAHYRSGIQKMFAYELSNDGYWCDPQNVCDKQYNITNSPVNISVNDSEYFHGLPKYSIDIPLLLNKEFMEQMAQRLAPVLMAGSITVVFLVAYFGEIIF
ncbi:MAG: hypothetical protein A2665_02485 [Candidatus Zambryskibacteria bacterium RIFCSPHIGHO2_01_FULL_46_30]|uniref:Uncharacterized protein n=1 Tax=Candidatus Zambryskibacteria bacterium RIFCSPHIGHO2_01_FULL_46_30 TaxID=1802739 RepID=A0A1G2SZV9_9BACT|nr:MAG: hypothetical protein A2665_02485 [Candidatus Zambryskibacteria bacterium RIFCSPHIGHO2_01_FULL_46_30]OHB06673.1 MAG: hypothetical protein A3B22_00985 [Candidatus Zambryskibacteria bacterium RIFCSPLOWO2_01_FULL_47_33]